jgi:hypothetical protein
MHMESAGKKTILLAAVVGLCEVVALHCAFAGQPLEKMTAALSRGKDSHSSAAAPGLKGRLDLRPPSESTGIDEAVAGPSFAPDNHRLFAGQLSSRIDATRAASPPASQNGHIMSPMESLVHNYRQDGLPVAKLFQSNESLVHLGLNPKGKPGLWIVHKLH